MLYEVNNWIYIYLLAINIITFTFFGLDKWKAVHGKWRIRVSTLLGLVFVGGAFGGLIAMYMFRHKTKTSYFTVGVPVMLFVQVTVVVYLKIKGIL